MFFDLHNDMPTISKPFMPIKTGNATVIHAIWTTKLESPIKFIDNYYDVNQNVLTAIEDLGFVAQNNLSAFATLKRIKPLYASLTWNNQNDLAGGAFSQGGLTDLGKDVITKIEGMGITLDTAHLNKQSFYQAAEFATMPIICTHTCFNGVYDHKRNLSDEQISIIINSGGIVGLTLVSDFMGSNRATIDDVMRQIDYYCGKFGHSTLAFGTDFYGTDKPALSDYEAFDTLFNRLAKNGYTNEQVTRIFYKNAHDFFKL